MQQTEIALKEYKMKIEVLSGLCTGGGEKSCYSTDEYILVGNRIYFLSFKDMLNLRQKGIITDKELEELYTNINNNKDLEQKIKDNLKSLKLTDEYDNSLNIYKFGSIMDFSQDELQEKRAIMGSTIKGLFRHGFELYNLNSVKYQYNRGNDNRLKIYGLDTINNKNSLAYETNKKDNKDKKPRTITRFPKGRFINNNYKINSRDADKRVKNAVDYIFRNTIFSDCIETQSEFMIEKVNRWHRIIQIGIVPQYYETAQQGSLFEGSIKYKQYTNKSIMYGNNTPIDIALESLKAFYSKVIDLEHDYFTSTEQSDFIDRFYRDLKEENSKSNQVVCKLGYSGAISKTLLAYDKTNDKQKLLPYTLNYIERTHLPMGWVKIKLEEKNR